VAGVFACLIALRYTKILNDFEKKIFLIYYLFFLTKKTQLRFNNKQISNFYLPGFLRFLEAEIKRLFGSLGQRRNLIVLWSFTKTSRPGSGLVFLIRRGRNICYLIVFLYYIPLLK